MSVIYGIIIGWISFYILLAFYNRLKDKRGLKEFEYRNINFTAKLRDIIRHIVFEYDIKRKNNDFLYTIKLDGMEIMQLMHRAHFPELCKSEADIDFGIALYIPVVNWSHDKVKRLDDIIVSETIIRRKINSGEIEYFLIDLGKRVRFSGYLLSRIIKEIFNAEDSRFSFELFSEGNLPYSTK